jgi:TonB family protein
MGDDLSSTVRKIAPEQGLVAIAVRVNRDGTIASVSVQKSSGNAKLDALGLKIAREAAYNPATANCSPVSGQYVYWFGWMR